MRVFTIALTMSLCALVTASAQIAMPESENGRYSFTPVADGVLRLDTRTGQVSQCSRNDAGWTCKAVPDERSSLEAEIARLQGENATLKKELLARGQPLPAVRSPPAAKPGEPELKLPSNADVAQPVRCPPNAGFWRYCCDVGALLSRNGFRRS